MVAIGLLVIGGGAPAAFAQSGGSYATALQSLTLSTHSVKGGANVYANVRLNQAVPSGTFRVGLASSDSSAASIKEAVVFTTGQTDKNVLVSTSAVSSDTTVSITGTDQDGNVASDSLIVRAVTLHRFTLNAQKVYGETPVTGTVELDSAAPAGGVDVSLSSNSAAAHVDSIVHVSGGAVTATTAITTHAVSTDTTATLTADLSGVSIPRNLTVNAPDISAMKVHPHTVNGGQSNATGKVSLTSPAPASYTAALNSNDGSVAGVPATVTFTGGSKTATFSITVGHPLNNSTATITAVAGGTQRSDLIHVKGLHIAVRFADGADNTITHAAAGSVVNLRILLSEIAAGDEPLTLTTSDGSKILVPATSKVIDGHTERSIFLTVGPTTGAVTVTVTLTHNGDTAHASFNVD